MALGSVDIYPSTPIVAVHIQTPTDLLMLVHFSSPAKHRELHDTSMNAVWYLHIPTNFYYIFYYGFTFYIFVFHFHDSVVSGEVLLS